MREVESAASEQVFREHEALCRKVDETGRPVHMCHDEDAPVATVIDVLCGFVRARSHTLGASIFGCRCGQCARLNAERVA